MDKQVVAMVSLVLFWGSIVILFYIYFGYLLLLKILSFFKKPFIPNKKEIYPYISIIVTAHNEEKHIKKKLEWLTSIDYPEDSYEVIVCSDASTDNTDRIVQEFPHPQVRLVRLKERGGKSKAQNEGVKNAKGEILIFSDATTEFHPSSIKELVFNFNDPNVGCVGGELYYRTVKGGEGGGLYWTYEKLLKKLENRLGILHGVSGCLFAIKRELYELKNISLIEDFYLPLHTLMKGKKNVYEPNARAYEETTRNYIQEWRMRVRVAVQSYNVLWHARSLFNPFKYGAISLALFSHKLLRYLAGIFMIIAFITNIFLALDNLFYFVLLCGQILFYFMVLIEFLYQFYKKKRFSLLTYIPFYFCLVNGGALWALILYLKGERFITWQPIRD